MTDDKPTRRDLMKPIQLLGLAFGAALFTGIVALVSMGFFQQRGGGQVERAAVVAAVAAGIAFIAVLLIVSLLLLAVDPAQVRKQIDRPVLLDDDADGARADGTADGGPKPGPDAAASGDPKP